MKPAWLPSREQLENNRWLRWLRPFLGHPRLWHWSRQGVALGVALGVFFGLFIPIAQIPLTAAAAVLLRANIPAAAASTLVTNPLTFGPIYYGAYRLGLWVTGETRPAVSRADTVALTKLGENGAAGGWSRLIRLGKPLLTGLAIMATLMGLIAYLAITLIWRWQILAKRRNRGNRR